MKTQTKKDIDDPFAKREAEKYDNPIVSREHILELLSENGSPISMKRIAAKLNYEDDTSREALRRRLNAMERDGQIMRNRRGDLCPIDKLDLVRGRITGHPDGFGFLIADDGGEDVFLTERQMRAALHGDRVIVRISGVDRRGRREGAIVEVLEHGNHSVVGRFCKEKKIAYVVPDNKRINRDIIIPAESCADAVDGQVVIAAIVSQPNRRSPPVGEIKEVLGDHMAPGMEVEIAIRAHELPNVWPDAVTAESAAYGTAVTAVQIDGREDLRALPFVTIDGEDARDFDDAVYCEKQPHGWRLMVAIADVSSYVAPDSALDEEAQLRGNSVYFPGEVIAMLPEVLSNGLCSLNPHVDRLCLVCEMEIDDNANVIHYRFIDAVMHSHARFTYSRVAALLVENQPAVNADEKATLAHLETLFKLYQILQQGRQRRGAIDFETTETQIVFGEQRKIERIVPSERNDAHRLIEECMLIANETTAKYLLSHEMPTLYRVHNGPTEDKLTSLREFLTELGLRLEGGDKPQARHLDALLQAVKGRPDFHLIQTVLLRSLSQAVYSPDNNGHFGLAYDAYAHFTSPIRRYPDLLVHRAIRHLLNGGDKDNFRYDHSNMERFGDRCSTTERRADEATRDATDWLKCEYMMDKIGEEYDGIITTVTGFGLFVELNDIYVEGLVHISALDQDYYHFDPVRRCLTAEQSRHTFRLADKLKVKVARVDLDDKKIDFVLAAPPPGGGKKKKKSRRRKRK